MPLEKTQNTGDQTCGTKAENVVLLRDPRRRPCPPAPPPPRISDKIADKIKVFGEKTTSEDNKSSSSSQADSGSSASNVTQVQNVNGPNTDLDAVKATVSTSESENQVKAGQLSGTPGRIESSRCSPPSTPSSPLRDEDEMGKDQVNCKVKANRSSEEMIETVSTFLKTRDDSLAKCIRNFRDLRKRYDAKKAELNDLKPQMKELRKQVELLSREKKEVQNRLEEQIEDLEEELGKVKGDLETLKNEKEAKITTESEVISKLQYTQVALDGQKLLADMHSAKVNQLERENADLRKIMLSQNARIGVMKGRIKSLEAAIQEDVNDKNVMVGSFNLYMANTQRRVEEIFVKKGEFFEDPRLEGNNVSSMSQLAIKGENAVNKDSNIVSVKIMSLFLFFNIFTYLNEFIYHRRYHQHLRRQKGLLLFAIPQNPIPNRR